jgi:pyruvate dehydrogenase E2 component (dihydrolipoamide acetyltransferase)
MPVDVLVPPVGTTVDTLTLISWYKREGETVVKDEPLFAVQTDKATLDIEAPASGILCLVCAEPGEDVVSLSRIASIRQADEVVETSARPPKTVVEPQPLTSVQPAPDKTIAKPVEHVGSRIFISPRAKKLAEANGIDWKTLAGTGPEGAIVERDVPPPRALPSIASPGSAMSAALTAYADATGLVEFHSRIQTSGLAVSYDALFVQILGRALTEHPQMNALPDQDGIHIGILIDTDEELAPTILHNVVGKRLSEIESEIKLAQASDASASFRLVNLGAFGVATFTSALDADDCPMLSVGQIRQNMVWLSLTFNGHKVGAGHAMRFLQRVVQFIEEPHLLLI